MNRCEIFVRQLSALGLVKSEQVSGLYSVLAEPAVKEADDGPCEVCEFYTIMDLTMSELTSLRQYLHERGLEKDYDQFKEKYWHELKQLAIVVVEKLEGQSKSCNSLSDVLNAIHVPKET